MNGNNPTIKTVEYRNALVDPAASVAGSAVVGSSAEWRDQITRYPAIVHQHAVIREGARVQAGVLRETIIGERALIMGGASIGHDTLIGADVEVGAGAVIGGRCFIGAGARIGSGTVVMNRVNIGENARVGIGAVVTRDIPADQTWVGNPARRLA